MEQLYSNWADLKEIWYLKIFGKYDEKISRFSKISEEQRMIYVKPDMFLWSYLPKLLLEWEILQTNL